MIRLTVLFPVLFLLFSVSCTPPLILSVAANQSNRSDTIIIYTNDPLLKYNACQVYNYDKTTGLYKFTLTNQSEPLVIFKERIKNCGSLNKCQDSVIQRLPVSYLKFEGKGCSKVHIEEAKNKNEIIDFFRKGENGRIVFSPCELK